MAYKKDTHGNRNSEINLPLVSVGCACGFRYQAFTVKGARWPGG